MVIRVLAWTGVLLLCLLVGSIGALALAAVVEVPVLFLGGGTLAASLVWAAYCRLLLQRREIRRARIACIIGVLTIGGAVASVLVPLGDPLRSPPPPPGAGTWHLRDGDHLAYGMLPAAASAAEATPVIAVHGGPGVPDTSGLLNALRPLTSDGHDVWAYDQRGTGRSARLTDPRRYTTEQAVADLEQVRLRIGAPRVILIGHSYGAFVTVAYIDAHPGRVEQVVFSSPGALSTSGTGGYPQARLNPAQRRALHRLLLAPRALFAYALVQVNPAAAHAFADDPEVDARQDRVYAATVPALHCPGHTGPTLAGNGFYANQVPQSLRAPAAPVPHPSPEEVRIPALVVKGRCDYLDWASALEYLETFPNSTLAYLRHAGHDTYREQPAAFTDTVRAFLANEPIPYTLVGPKAYQGGHLPH